MPRAKCRRRSAAALNSAPKYEDASVLGTSDIALWATVSGDQQARWRGEAERSLVAIIDMQRSLRSSISMSIRSTGSLRCWTWQE